jgi:plasmid stabilization system protein ParE
LSEYSLSPEADHDLVEIWCYVFELSHAPERADRAVRELETLFGRIAEFPKIGVAHEVYGPGVMLFPGDRYYVLYRERPGGIDVVRVTGADSDLLSPA